MNSKLLNPLFFARILLILMIVVIIYLVAGFVRQVDMSQQRKAELRQVEQDIVIAEEELAQLDEQLSFANSDEAVFHWALENGWGRPNEVLVVLVEPAYAMAAPGGENSDREGTASETPSDSWWDLFFAQR